MAAKTEDRPYIENYPPLSEWLKKHNACCMWQKDAGDWYTKEPNHGR